MGTAVGSHGRASTAPSGSHVPLVRSGVPLSPAQALSLALQQAPLPQQGVSLWPADCVGPWPGDGWRKALGSWTKVEPQGTVQPLVWGPQHPLLHASELLAVVTQRGWGSSISAFVPDKPSSGTNADDASDLGAKAPMLSHVLSQALLPDLGCFLLLTVMPVKSLKTSVGLVPKASSTCVTHVKWDLTGFC